MSSVAWFAWIELCVEVGDPSLFVTVATYCGGAGVSSVVAVAIFVGICVFVEDCLGYAACSCADAVRLVCYNVLSGIE